MLRKPVEKQSCVGCGYCCIRNTCSFGVAKHPQDLDKTCPELSWTGTRYTCKLMAADNKLADFYRRELQAGGGCRSFNNPWRQDVRKREGPENLSGRSGTPRPLTPDEELDRK